MKALFALMIFAASAAQAQNALLLQCNSNEYDVSVTLNTKTLTNQDIVTVSISDFSGHGKDYTAVLPRGTWPTALASGLAARSTEDSGTITFTESGKVGTVTGEMPAQVQCVDLTSDNPSGE